MSFALLAGMFISMSSFTVAVPPAKKKVVINVSKTATFPITGSASGYTYRIEGSNNVPSYIVFNNGTKSSDIIPFSTTGSAGSSQFLAGVPHTASSSSFFTPYPTITAVFIGIFTNQPGYSLTFYPVD